MFPWAESVNTVASKACYTVKHGHVIWLPSQPWCHQRTVLSVVHGHGMLASNTSKQQWVCSRFNWTEFTWLIVCVLHFSIISGILTSSEVLPSLCFTFLLFGRTLKFLHCIHYITTLHDLLATLSGSLRTYTLI